MSKIVLFIGAIILIYTIGLVIGWIIDAIEYRRAWAEIEADMRYKTIIDERERVFKENIRLSNENQKLHKENLWLKEHQEIKIVNLENERIRKIN